MKRRIGIFGGSFNPIHVGHIAIAEAVRDSGAVDEVWLMVSPRNPLKEQSSLMPDTQRLRLAKNAVRNIEGVCASDFEFSLPRPSYTAITMQRLEDAYPYYQFSLLIGADNWTNFPRWYHYRDLLERYPIIIYPRQGFPINTAALPPSVTYIHMPLLNISSTQIRQMMANGEDITALVPKENRESGQK